MVIHTNLSSLTASALAAALIAVASVLAFSWLLDLLMWAAFVGWASYGVRRCRGVDGPDLRATGALTLSPSLTAAICASIASSLIVMASRIPCLSIVPSFCGSGSTLAYLCVAPSALL
jgi:hypothetical protein